MAHVVVVLRRRRPNSNTADPKVRETEPKSSFQLPSFQLPHYKCPCHFPLPHFQFSTAQPPKKPKKNPQLLPILAALHFRICWRLLIGHREMRKSGFVAASMAAVSATAYSASSSSSKSNIPHEVFRFLDCSMFVFDCLFMGSSSIYKAMKPSSI